MPDHQAGILLPFEGIPDLIQWSIKQGTRRLLEACKEQGGAEAALKYLFVFAINAIPEVRKGIESNYGKRTGTNPYARNLRVV